MSLKLHKLNHFQKFVILCPYPICSQKTKDYFEKLDKLTLSRIQRLRKYMYASTNFAKEEVLRCANAIKNFNPGPFSKSYFAILRLSVELNHLDKPSED